MSLTERVLARLPGPRWLWVVLWALSAPARPAVLLVMLASTGDSARLGDPAGVFASQAVFAYVILVALWGTPRLVAGVRSLTGILEGLAPSDDAARSFPRLTSGSIPIVVTIVVVAIATPSTAVEFGPQVALVDAPLLFVMTLPIVTFLWTYIAFLAGLDRLGRAHLALDLFPQDRTLGLAPVGSAAVVGLWTVLAAAVPPLLVTGGDLTTFGLSVAAVAGTVLLFVLSMSRLHGQMHRAKQHYLADTRALVAQAYAPIRADSTLATVEAEASALAAAHALSDRADRLLEWPIDERMVAFVTVVVTGVLTSLIVSFVLRAVGA